MTVISHYALRRSHECGATRKLAEYLVSDLRAGTTARAEYAGSLLDHSLAEYFNHAKSDQRQYERFLGFRTRNLPPGIDYRTAMFVLAANGATYEGRAADLLHLTLVPHPHDRLLQTETWDQIHEVYLRELGLHEHWSVVVRHGDGHRPWRASTGDQRDIYHEHHAISLIEPGTGRRTDVSDILQKLEIADGYVEQRWGVMVTRDRPKLRWRSWQLKRKAAMARLGRRHRAGDKVGMTMPIPKAADVARQRRAERRRLHAMKQLVASAVRKLLGELNPRSFRSWATFREALKRLGLRYEAGAYRRSHPSTRGGRFCFVGSDGKPSRIAASKVADKWKLSALEDLYGSFPPPATSVRNTGVAAILTRIPAPSELAECATLADVTDLLNASGLRYEERLIKTRRGQRILSGYIVDANTEISVRAPKHWSIAALRRRLSEIESVRDKTAVLMPQRPS